MLKTRIYQLLPRLFGNLITHRTPNGSIQENGCGKWDEITSTFLNQLKEQGFTHVWYTGVLRQASATAWPELNLPATNANVVKGQAGSPYAITDYYDVSPDYATHPKQRMQEFEALIDRTHKAGLKCLIDFVPNHVARGYHSVVAPEGTADFGATDRIDVAFDAQNNFYHLPNRDFFSPVAHLDVPYHEKPARASGNDAFTATPSVNDWYETVKLNYGVYNGQEFFSPTPDTWHKMHHILRYWAEKGVDGFRVDMAEMVPLAFWKWVIENLKTQHPNLLFVAEAYNQSLYRPFLQAGFDLLYDKVIFYDTLRAVMQQQQPARNLSNIWKSTGDIQDHLLLFLENHDEQRLASTFFMGNAFHALPGVALMLFYSRSALMVYFGQELGEPGMDAEGFSGQDGRTSIFDYWGIELWQKYVNQHQFDGKHLPSEALQIKEWYTKIFRILSENKALETGSFYDLTWYNENPALFPGEQVYAFLRFDEQSRFLIVANFSANTHQIYLRIPWDVYPLLHFTTDSWITGTDLMNQTLCLQGDANLANARGLGLRLEPYSVRIIKLEQRG